MQGRVNVLILSLGVLLGCAQEHGTTEAPVSGDVDAAVSSNCDDIQAEAVALAEAGATCQQDSDCIYTYIDGKCLYPFLCGRALNQNVDIDKLRAEAARLSAEYQECTNSCAIASCLAVESAFCNPTTKRCEPRL